MTQIRLNKFLSESGVCSRRQADEHILAGEVKINGKVAKLGDRVDPEKDNVYFKNEIVRPQKGELVYYALYKPRGVISTSSDEARRESVVDLVPEEPRVYPVGRLDKESEGLIILTNDGKLANELMHPRFEHKKYYRVETRITDQKIADKGVDFVLKRFSSGIEIDGKLMQAEVMSRPKVHNSKILILDVALRTGYNRQVRKMCAKMGLEVVKLVRTQIGILKLEDLKLKPGEYRKISKAELLPRIPITN